MRVSRSGFTIVELLVVISVIAILVSLLIPALRSAKESAKTTVCLAELRATLNVTINYATDCKEYPDMGEASSVNLTPQAGNPLYPSGVINKDGATDMFTSGNYTVQDDYVKYNGVQTQIPNRPKWFKLLNDLYGKQSPTAWACNTERGTWSRNKNPTYFNIPWYGFNWGIQGSNYLYFGPLVHWDDVNPFVAMAHPAVGLVWISNSPIDPTIGWPSNWDLRAKKDDKGVLFCCPSPTYDGPDWADWGSAIPSSSYWEYDNGDFISVRPHGMTRTDRNYGFTDGHAVTLMQRAEEGYAIHAGIGNVWNNSPNGYF